MKKLLAIHRSDEAHWVGDGFPVRTLFAYAEQGAELSPFLLLDYAGPVEFPPTERRLGVGVHPHRGFETVTIVYAGEVEHRDSSGAGGKIGPGDVQWMTAASGVVHEEFHGREFARRGGPFEMVQLWVNLPAKYKMSPPRYQGIAGSDIPEVELDGGVATLRVIAGEHRGRKGPALTFTPMQVWDLKFAGPGPDNASRSVSFEFADGHTTLLVGLGGEMRINGERSIGSGEVAHLDRAGTGVCITGEPGARVLLLSGEPIDEPIAGYGPFVMNSADEIHQAIADYQSGKMGSLSG